MKSKQCLVIGLGRFGTAVATTLYEMGHEVVAVDTNEENVENVMSRGWRGRCSSPANSPYARSRSSVASESSSSESEVRSMTPPVGLLGEQITTTG